ncbi:hypothetical protein HY484_00820 [Candidatus Woesearchaeota archaeon]|nr:hypothetical protein [Candidatus Woesearchaeota archaeon]
MQWYEPIIEQLLILLQAPISNTELLWIATPLLVTILVMTFYFGLYKREELGWNTSVGNSIVLMFVCVDLLRTMYHYSATPTLMNFVDNPWKSTVVAAILLEAIIMILFAFYHLIPAKIMYFIASPLPVNLQAYIISTIVYTRISPNRYTAYAAITLFFAFFIVINLFKILESIYVTHRHKKIAEEVKQLMHESKILKKEAKKAKKQRKEIMLGQAQEKKDRAKILASKLATAEQMQHGELVLAKKLLRLNRKNFMF